MRARRSLAIAGGTAIALLVLVQLLPYGRPSRAVGAPPQIVWIDARTQDLATRACLDCHSAETRWPWYASVAPVSWVVAHHVDEGRGLFDFSATGPQPEAHEAGETVREGEMPPNYYLWLHPEARLTAGEKVDLAAGLDAMFGGEAEGEEEEDDD